jgi:hypothetical protein
MSGQAELFDRAAECNRLMNLESNEDRKTAFRLLGEMWIALANECPGMSAERLAKEISSIEEIQNGIVSGKP